MFVLRSHDLDSAAQPANGGARTAGEGGDAARRERRGFVAAVPGRDSGAPGTVATARPMPARPGHDRSASMHMPLFAAAFAVRFGGATAASECPKRLGDVQALIDRVGAGVDRAGNRLGADCAALVHALLDDARMLLEAGRQNHERPRGAYDHARAFAKADAALGHARAAQVVLARGTRE